MVGSAGRLIRYRGACGYTHDAIKIGHDRIMELISSIGRRPGPRPENDPSGVYLLHYDT
jgi:hypothetical protein